MKTKKIPMRMCVGCREMKPKKELIRVVRSPEGSVSIDPTGKKSGRGAYVCRQGDCLQRAIRQKQLERQLETSLGEETAAQLQQTLEQVRLEETGNDG
ncbi:MAG: YlxR family protein [Clostridia bacterium]|nr:YlxR family protein [Clostridia bacterium]